MSDQKGLLHFIIKLYYVDGLGQNEISRIAGLSRPQISRLLARARELGLVQIQVAEYKTFFQSVSVNDISS